MFLASRMVLDVIVNGFSLFQCSQIVRNNVPDRVGYRQIPLNVTKHIKTTTFMLFKFPILGLHPGVLGSRTVKSDWPFVKIGLLMKHTQLSPSDCKFISPECLLLNFEHLEMQQTGICNIGEALKSKNQNLKDFKDVFLSQ